MLMTAQEKDALRSLFRQMENDKVRLLLKQSNLDEFLKNYSSELDRDVIVERLFEWLSLHSSNILPFFTRIAAEFKDVPEAPIFITAAERLANSPAAIAEEALVENGQVEKPQNRRLRRGLSSKVGSVHLHVDGDDYLAADRVLETLNLADVSETVQIQDSIEGSQRSEAGFAQIYDMHTPQIGRKDALEFFTTTVLHEDGDLDAAAIAEVEFKVAQILGQLTIEMASKLQSSVVVEVEVPVGVIANDDSCEWREPCLGKTPFQGGWFPFRSQDAGRPLYETHIGIDLPKTSNKPPISLEELRRISRESNKPIGGWFIFDDESRWAYRSNSFSKTADQESAKSLHRFFKAALAKDGRSASVKVLVEKTLGIWRMPFTKSPSIAVSLPELFRWERVEIQDKSEFFVVTGNFLGDLHQSLIDAMRDNLLRGIRYSYFLRSFADLVRWKNFRDGFRNYAPNADTNLKAYVFEFALPTMWKNLDCFIGMGLDGKPQGYRIRRDILTGKTIAAHRMDMPEIRKAQSLLKTFVQNDRVLSGRRLGPADEFDAALIWIEIGGEEERMKDLAVGRETFDQLDHQFAAEISRSDGEVITSHESRYVIVVRKDRIRGEDGARSGLSERAQTIRRAFMLGAKLSAILARTMGTGGTALAYRMLVGYETFKPVFRSSGPGIISDTMPLYRQHARILTRDGHYAASTIWRNTDWNEQQICGALASFKTDRLLPNEKTQYRRFEWSTSMADAAS